MSTSNIEESNYNPNIIQLQEQPKLIPKNQVVPDIMINPNNPNMMLSQFNQQNQVSALEQNDPNISKDPQPFSLYLSCLDNIGGCVGTLRIWLPFPFCFCADSPQVQIDTGFEGLLSKFGVYQKKIQPSLFQFNPWSESVQVVCMKQQMLDLPGQVVFTRDNITCFIDTSVQYKITDSRAATYKVCDLEGMITSALLATLRQACGELEFQTIQDEKEMVAKKIQQILDTAVMGWGIIIIQTFMKDIKVGPDLSAALSKTAEEKKNSEQKLISAKADVQNAKLIRQSADSMNTKAAMQIRYLDTLQKICTSNNSKIIMLPKELKK